jgi:hypothetical protein
MFDAQHVTSTPTPYDEISIGLLHQHPPHKSRRLHVANIRETRQPRRVEHRQAPTNSPHSGDLPKKSRGAADAPRIIDRNEQDVEIRKLEVHRHQTTGDGRRWGENVLP